ncbi:ATP-binding protein [Trichlorobacter lovleyi]|uniref:Cobyrinic acid ac-diamide synthase n=1 Tax=Trichlorobacter lovleyi (strain ATCC BAA-1151 / DSM 17278 / SZ) TaxID=398767 RepID=B3EAG6_TRIL1|nr:ATP-binding protein [Trichlorobacter lovleyi]ACD95404.1 Cobyrinic acid ac-diamide synthase [Trichlorobacter lovleyi SZ]
MSKEHIRELVVLSGKGGTGKTSVTASFALLAKKAVLADCDVDAADLHLLLTPMVEQRHAFMSGHEAVIRQQDCTGCGICMDSCRFDAIRREDISYRIDPVACEGCGVCYRLCPVKAIDFPDRVCGEWMVSGTRCGPMVHAQLGVAAENSGKLVTTVREQAWAVAVDKRIPLIISDGPPGIGCPVIASLSGVSLAVVITEPTVSGLHDLQRLLALARHFSVPTAVCVNKWDINPQQTERIEAAAEAAGAAILGRIRYDRSVTQAQLQQKAVVELEAAAGDDIRVVWKQVTELL